MELAVLLFPPAPATAGGLKYIILLSYYYSVAKQIAPTDPNPQDINLDSDLFIMYGGTSESSSAQSLGTHRPSGNPLLTSRFNPVRDVGGANPFPTVPLLRAHGIIMLIAWPLLAISGIFFAAWMRPALPNGGWFQVYTCKHNLIVYRVQDSDDLIHVQAMP